MHSLVPFRFDWKQILPFTVRHTVRGKDDVHDIWRLHDGSAVTLRAARADDGPLMQELVRGLSLQSRYQRFFYPLRELTPDMLARFTQHDLKAAMTLLALARQNGRQVAVAMAQYVADPYPQRCDFTVVVADAWQGHGLGTRLIQTLACIAHAAGIGRIEGDILTENEAMQRLVSRMGFGLTQHEDGAYLMKASKELGMTQPKCSPLTGLAAQAEHHADLRGYVH